MTKMVKEIVDEYVNRHNKETYKSIVIKDGTFQQRFSEITNLVVTGNKIEFDYNEPIEVIYTPELFRKEWVHKEFIGAEIVERTKSIEE